MFVCNLQSGSDAWSVSPGRAYSDWVINKNNPKVAVKETGGRGIQVDIKSGECQQ